MTERKPPGVSWQSWIDRQIDEARANGEFDDLPGHGKPFPGVDRPRDELWWVRDKLRREGVEYLPPALAIRKQAAEAREQALAARSEADARRILEHINAAIRHLNRSNVDEPPTTLTAFDVDEVLDERRRRHAEHAEQVDERAAPPAPPPEPVPGRPPRRRWRLGRGRSR